jgi:hypothetical protein
VRKRTFLQRSSDRAKVQQFELQKHIAMIKLMAIPFRNHAHWLRSRFDQRTGHNGADLRSDLERAIIALRQHGIQIEDESLVHLLPIGWEHINLTGDYTWQTAGRLRKGAFRPLRSFAASNE